MQLFTWTRNPSQAAKIAQRKEEIYDEIMNGQQPAEVPGCRNFLDTLRNYNVSGWWGRMGGAPAGLCLHLAPSTSSMRNTAKANSSHGMQRRS
jgi:hypothetical protein